MESFFGHMKDELDASSCKNCRRITKESKKFHGLLQFLRYKWEFKKMTLEFQRVHFTALLIPHCFLGRQKNIENPIGPLTI